MKILVVHAQFLRSGEPGGTRFNDFARHWSDAGHDVRVVASSVNYLDGRRRLWGAEDTPAQVRRAWTFAHPRGQRGARFRSMLGFGVSGSLLALSYPLWRPDVVVASSPTLTAAVPGLVAASRYQTPFVFEVRDLWPESAVTTGVMSSDSAWVRAAQGLEEAAYGLADRVVCLTPGIRDDIVARGVDSARVEIIPNGVDVESWPIVDRDSERRALGWADKFVVLYSGAHGLANDLEQVLAAAAQLTHRKDIRFVLMGDGPQKPKLRQVARREGLANVEFRDPVAPSRSREILACADLGLVVLQHNPTFRTVYPNKMFEAMAAELPVLSTVDGIARELLMREEAGLFVAPEHPAELARAVSHLAADPVLCLKLGWNGRQAVERDFDRREHAARYLALFGELTGG